MTLSIAGLIFACALGLSFNAPDHSTDSQTNKSADHVIHLTARDGVFKQASIANPTLRLPADATTKIVLSNRDHGVHHAISIPEIHDQTVPVPYGETVELRVHPKNPGSYEYICGHHLPVMKGTLIVTPAESNSSKRTASNP